MAAATLESLAAQAATCTACRLSETRTNVVFGVGSPASGLLFVGEGPGRDEDLQGEPFVGRSGRLLDRLVLEELGLRRDAFYIANVVKCRPPGNRDPLPDEVAACAGFLEGQLAILDPRVVVSLGNVATRVLLGTEESISTLRGRAHAWRGRTLVPTFHPAYALRGGGAVVAQMRADLIRAKRALAGPP
jgi:DNA polymerase